MSLRKKIGRVKKVSRVARYHHSVKVEQKYVGDQSCAGRYTVTVHVQATSGAQAVRRARRALTEYDRELEGKLHASAS